MRFQYNLALFPLPPPTRMLAELPVYTLVIYSYSQRWKRGTYDRGYCCRPCDFAAGEELGSGRFGCVILASHIDTATIVAMKLFSQCRFTVGRGFRGLFITKLSYEQSI